MYSEMRSIDKLEVSFDCFNVSPKSIEERLHATITGLDKRSLPGPCFLLLPLFDGRADSSQDFSITLLIFCLLCR
ncbi:unnamed protein product [Leptidea sinapis]|uniref:Uncharacterized protein n=1 Tax=Leptidea sinapis TaxID=189913 RepID=A0A5E4PXN2_9NEOP|nr:unnamed protein product [Leptidea sinapis]